MMMGTLPTSRSRQATLQSMIEELGRLVEVSIARAITALIQRDPMLAGAVIQEDSEIDRLEVEIQELCLEILEHERPTGDDLRQVVAILKINDSLERIGDLSENVAEVVVEVRDSERFRRVPGISDLAEMAQDMVLASVQALTDRDPHAARDVIAADDRVDAQYEKIKGRIAHELDRIPENARQLLKLEHVVRQFERMADVATNIAEEVIYIVEGQIVRHR